MEVNLKEKSIDWATASIDTGVQKLLESDMFSGIPFVGLLVSSAKLGLSLRDKFFISKIRKMLDDLGLSDPIKLKEFAESIDQKYSDEKIGIALFTLIDTSEDYEKSVIAGKILKYALANDLPKEKLLRLLSIVNRAYTPYLRRLESLLLLIGSTANQINGSEIIEHLFSIGLLSNVGYKEDKIKLKTGQVYKLNKFGFLLKGILFPVDKD